MKTNFKNHAQMRQSIVRYILFFIAYLPIYIIGALKTIKGPFTECGTLLPLKVILLNNLVPAGLIIFSILLIIYFVFYSKYAIKPTGTPLFTIKKCTLQHKEYITYLGTYILPFVGLKADSVFDMIAVVFMFLTIGFIYSKTKLIYTNPTLLFFHYEIYEIEDEEGNKYDCISKELLKEGDKVIGRKLGNNTFIISKWKNQN